MKTICDTSLLASRAPRWKHLAGFLVFLFCIVLGLRISASESSLIRLAMENTGADTDAGASLLSSLSLDSALLTIQASNLTPGLTYTFVVDGRIRGTFTAKPSGRGSLTFARPASATTSLLDFDPRGTFASIAQDSTVILQAVVSGVGEPANITVDERTSLTRVTGSKRAAAGVKYRIFNSSERRFTVTLTNVTDATWSVYVDGVLRGNLQTRHGGGRLQFANNGAADGPLLDFDPRSRVIDIVRDGVEKFTGLVEAKSRNISFATPSVLTGFVPSTGVDADGTALTRARTAGDATREFCFELKDVPVGVYELLVDGILQGTIGVLATASGSEGEIEFSTGPDDQGEFLLTFSPRFATYTVRQGDTVYFQGKITSAMSFSGYDNPTLLEEPLTSTGLDSDPHGQARFEIDPQGRRDFRVEIEDVPLGTYQLWVGGQFRGSIIARLTEGRIQGEIEFAAGHDNPDHLPLDFEPRGKLVSVLSQKGVYFAHLFGIGATNAAVAAPFEIELPLFSAGVASNATAEIAFRRDDHDQIRFSVELQDVPVGDYTLLVAAVAQGTISVVTTETGTRGKIEFEDEAESGELELTFDPLGQVITIERGGVTYFERTLPAN